MPTLPDVQSLGARPTPRPQRGVSVYNGGRAEVALGELGAQIGRIGETMQREDDTAAVFAARRQLDDWERQAIYDPEKGAKTRLGQDAFGVPQELAQSYDEFSAKLAEGMTSTRQRQAFAEMSAGRRDQVLDWAAGHAAQQREVYHTAEVGATLESTSERAKRLAVTLTDGSPEGLARREKQVREELQLGRGLLESFMRERGAPDADIAKKTLEFTTQAHESIVKELIAAGDNVGADKYLKAHQGEIKTDNATALRSSLREGVALGKAQAAADDVIDTKGLRGEAALVAVRKMFEGDPIGRQHAEAQVKTRLIEETTFRTQRAGELSGQLWDPVIREGRLVPVTSPMWEEFRRVAPEKARDEEKKMRDRLDAQWRRAKADAEGKKTENWGVYMMLTDMGINEETRDEFLKPETLAKYLPSLSHAQQANIVSLRTTLTKADAKAVDVLKAMKLVQNSIKGELFTAKIDTTPKEGTDAAKEYEAFLGRVRQRVIEEAASGAKIDDAKARQIGMDAIRLEKEQGSGWFFGLNPKEVRGFKKEPGKDYIIKTYGAIPSAVRDELLSQLAAKKDITGGRGKGFVADDVKAEVERMYARGVRAGLLKE